MIREHAFNSAWWGEPVGIVTDPAFFELDDAERNRHLRPFAWVEFSGALDAAAPQDLLRSRFFQIDTQVNFKLDLRRLPSVQLDDQLVVESATEAPISVDSEALASFAHERYRFLPGCTAARLNERYALWCARLIAEQPEWCLMVRRGVAVQGWFLAHQDASGFGLTLAALHRHAQLSGLTMYHVALREFGRRGQRVGSARFSVGNPAVMNIYAALGARFLQPTGYWLWLPNYAS